MSPRWLSLTRHRSLADPASDAALLLRYAEECDSAAFECLLWRHGGLVLGTCERMLRDRHLAEDAYQATFLILGRKAGTVRGLLPAWLHQVARRVCLRIRKRWPERLNADVAEIEHRPALEHRETAAILDAEIAKLPEKHRRVVVLCYLQNRTAEEAGRELGIPRGTVLSRLDAARRKLQVALTHRGIAPLAILTIPLIHAPPSAALVQMTQEAVGSFASGFLSTPITELAHEVLHMTTRKWIAGSAVGMIALAFASTGVGLFQSDGPATAQAMAQAPAGKPDKPAAPDNAKQEKIKEQLSQLRALDSTEEQLRQRIDTLNAKISKEQAGKDAEVSPRALMQAIDKIDQSLLDEEVKLRDDQNQFDYFRGLRREDKEYPLKSIGDIEVPNETRQTSFRNQVGNRIDTPISVILATIPEYTAHLKTLNTIRTKGREGGGEAATKKLLEEQIADFEKNTKAEVQKKVIAARRVNYHDYLSQQMEIHKQIIENHEAFPKTVAKRRAELVDRLRKASGVSEEQKLHEDELQVLREFRKAVLKQKLTLKLEMDGVKLPEEPKK